MGIRFSDLERNPPSCRGQFGRRKIIDEIPQNDRTDPVKDHGPAHEVEYSGPLRASWRAIAVFNLHAAAAMAVATVIAGWVLAVAPFVDSTPSLMAHRWAGVAAAGATLGAAAASRRRHVETARMVMVYRAALFGAAALMAIAGHLGAALVWGPDFLTR